MHESLESWADDVVARDQSRIGPQRAMDSDALVAELQTLDRQRIADAAAEIVTRCGDRRPTSTVGVAGVILRESQKQPKHMPI